MSREWSSNGALAVGTEDYENMSSNLNNYSDITCDQKNISFDWHFPIIDLCEDGQWLLFENQISLNETCILEVCYIFKKKLLCEFQTEIFLQYPFIVQRLIKWLNENKETNLILECLNYLVEKLIKRHYEHTTGLCEIFENVNSSSDCNSQITITENNSETTSNDEISQWGIAKFCVSLMPTILKHISYNSDGAFSLFMSSMNLLSSIADSCNIKFYIELVFSNHTIKNILLNEPLSSLKFLVIVKKLLVLYSPNEQLKEVICDILKKPYWIHLYPELYHQLSVKLIYEELLEIQIIKMVENTYILTSGCNLDIKKYAQLFSTSLPIIWFHKKYNIIDQFIADTCKYAKITEAHNENEYSNILLNLLSFKLSDVVLYTYLALNKTLKKLLNNFNSESKKIDRLIEVLFCTNVLNEIVCFGCVNSNVQICQLASEIMGQLLKCKDTIKDNQWKCFLNNLAPVFPVLYCYANQLSTFGQIILNFFDPDQAEKFNISKLVLLQSIIIMLLSKDNKSRVEANNRITWYLQTSLNKIIDLPYDIFMIEFDELYEKVEEPIGVYTETDLDDMIDLISNERSSNQTIKCALYKISVMLEYKNLQQYFIQNEGMNIILNLLKLSKLFVNERGMLIALLKLILCFTKKNKFIDKHNLLANNFEIQLQLIAVLSDFYKITHVKQYILQIFFYCIFDQYLTYFGEIPTTVLDMIHTPIKINKYGSSNNNRDDTIMLYSKIKDNKNCMDVLTLTWNLNHFENIDLFLENGLTKNPDDQLFKEVFHNFRKASIKWSVKNLLIDLIAVKSHPVALAILGDLKRYLELTVHIEQFEVDEELLENGFKKFLILPPILLTDLQTLIVVLKLLNFVLKRRVFVKKLKWVADTLTKSISMHHNMVNNFENDESSNKLCNQFFIELYEVYWLCLKNYSHFSTPSLTKLLFGQLVYTKNEFVLLQVNMMCLTVLTENPKNVDKDLSKLYLSQLVSLKTILTNEKSLQRRYLIILNHILHYTILLPNIYDLWCMYDWETWTWSMIHSTDTLVRALVFQLSAGLAIIDIPVSQNLIQLALNYFCESNCLENCVVAEQATIFCSNIFCNPKFKSLCYQYIIKLDFNVFIQIIYMCSHCDFTKPGKKKFLTSPKLVANICCMLFNMITLTELDLHELDQNNQLVHELIICLKKYLTPVSIEKTNIMEMCGRICSVLTLFIPVSNYNFENLLTSLNVIYERIHIDLDHCITMVWRSVFKLTSVVIKCTNYNTFIITNYLISALSTSVTAKNNGLNIDALNVISAVSSQLSKKFANRVCKMLVTTLLSEWHQRLKRKMLLITLSNVFLEHPSVYETARRENLLSFVIAKLRIMQLQITKQSAQKLKTLQNDYLELVGFCCNIFHGCVQAREDASAELPDLIHKLWPVVVSNPKSDMLIYTIQMLTSFTSDCSSDDSAGRNCSNCHGNCVDYQTWLRVQNCLHKVVRDPLFELFIMACIICNTIVLAIEHHGMSQNVRNVLDVGNKVFTTIFTVECLFKLIALSNEFFNCGWNIFDMIIVTASLLDLSFEMIDGLSVLRCLRLLRVLKLAQSWTTMKVLLSIIISTIGALGNLTFVLIIIIYIFAVIGMQLFSKEYMPEKFDPDPVPRWNFSDFFHSFMMIFRILCGEWIEPLWDCMKAEEKEGFGICFAIFLPALVMGNFMVLNLFLALLLNSFNSEELKSKKEQGQQEVDEEMVHYRERWAHHVRVISNLCHKCRAQNPSRTSSISLSNIPKDTIVSLVDHEEVGDGSKLERSFQRIRSIIRKRKRRQSQAQTTTCDNSINFKLESTVRQLIRIKNDKKKLKADVVNTSTDEREHQESCDYDVEIANRRAESDQNDGTSLVLNASYLDQKERTDRHMQRALTEDSSDTGYNQGPFTTQQTPVFNGQGSISDDLLYHQIMQDAMSYAPTLTRDIELPMLDETFELSEHRRAISPPAGMHRRSYILATRQDSSRDEIDEQDETCFLKQPKHDDLATDEKSKKKPWITLVSYVDELTVGGRRDSKGNFEDAATSFPGFGRNKQLKAPLECFPLSCYQRIGIKKEWVDKCFGERWMSFRQKTLVIVDTPIFEWFILVLIFASSVTLCFEDIYLDDNKTLKTTLYWTNFTFCVIFTIELMLKWIALGVHKYFKSFWTALDFIIAMMSIFSLLIDENENLKVLRSLRTLRALRPLRAISRWQGMRIVVNALMYAIPSIFNVLLVCLVFWLIFSIMGVQFFGGKFFKCVDDDGERVSVSIVNNRSDCMLHNYTWLNSKISFDNVGIAYLALFQVATFEGWMEVMADAVDARGVDLQPEYEANLYAYIYFVIFIVCGAFFTLNLFIGVIIDNFNMLKKKYEGGVLEMFLTESQKHYYTAMKKLGRKKPQKVIKRPVNQFMAIFYDLSNSRRFEVAIFVLIFLNMLTMGIEHYNQPVPVFFILEVCNAFFTTVFGLEALVKIVGLRFHYFTVPWNVFDFFLVLASVLGILMEDIMIDFPVSPTLLRVVRVFRIGRILRLIKAAKGIRKLLFALIVSLPALFNIGALLGLITFIYAIIGMSVFGHVKKQKAINDMVNFETFGRSMQLLFRLMTSAGWNDVLESLMVQPPDCELEASGLPNGNCGHPILAITYFTSFIIISYMIVINMYIAIILENFNQAHQEEEIGIVEDDLEMFYIRWSKYDPHATQFIAFNQISDFIASLDPPLGISKPNIVALVSFNLPIARGNKIHCLDILHALVKHVLGHVEETDEFKKLQDQMDVKFKKQFPTRKELEIVSSTRLWKRQDKAARLIQRTYRNFRRRKKDVTDLCSDTQSSSPGGWQSRLSSFLHVKGMSISGIGGGVGGSSRASSRKSSRASDASDISELGASLWLNLPLFLLSGTQLDVANKNEEQSPKKKSPAEGGGGGGVHITVSGPSPEARQDDHAERRNPRGRRQQRQQPSANVSITITDASPDGAKQLPTTTTVTTTTTTATTTAHTKRLAFRRASEAKIVQHKALVHRTSEGSPAS